MAKKEDVEKVFINRMIVKAKTANEQGISNERLRLLEKQGKIEKVDHGLYVHSDAPVDLLYAYQQRRQLIYSHETALYLHDLTDREPLNYSATVYKGYHSPKLKELGITLYYVKKEFLPVGVVTIETAFGNAVLAYSMERTLCDLVRNRSRLEKSLISAAFKAYVGRKDKDLHELMKLAKLFRVDKRVREYVELMM